MGIKQSCKGDKNLLLYPMQMAANNMRMDTTMEQSEALNLALQMKFLSGEEDEHTPLAPLTTEAALAVEEALHNANDLIQEINEERRESGLEELPGPNPIMEPVRAVMKAPKVNTKGMASAPPPVHKVVRQWPSKSPAPKRQAMSNMPRSTLYSEAWQYPWWGTTCIYNNNGKGNGKGYGKGVGKGKGKGKGKGNQQASNNAWWVATAGNVRSPSENGETTIPTNRPGAAFKKPPTAPPPPTMAPQIRGLRSSQGEARWRDRRQQRQVQNQPRSTSSRDGNQSPTMSSPSQAAALSQEQNGVPSPTPSPMATTTTTSNAPMAGAPTPMANDGIMQTPSGPIQITFNFNQMVPHTRHG